MAYKDKFFQVLFKKEGKEVPFQLIIILVSTLIVTFVDIFLIAIGSDSPIKGYGFLSFNIMLLYFFIIIVRDRNKRIKKIAIAIVAINLCYNIFDLLININKYQLSNIILLVSWTIVIPIVWIILLNSNAINSFLETGTGSHLNY